MSVLFSYVLRYDDGAAPNPFWGICTLTICKPAVRRKAVVGDWVIGTGSANAACNDCQHHDLSGQLVYAMKVTQVMKLPEYDHYCRRQLPDKLPDALHADWRRRMGDCIYNYNRDGVPTIRPGVHDEGNRARDLSGLNALLSTHFYYFGEQPVPLPRELSAIVKKGQGHRKITTPELILAFETWIGGFTLNKLEADPQLKHRFDGPMDNRRLAQCGLCQVEEDSSDEEDVVC